jgi:predicted nucleic acid-binding protein
METVVADTSALVSLAIPGADSTYDALSNPDPLQHVLTSCTVSVPDAVVAERREMAQYADIHATATSNVLAANRYYAVEDTYRRPDTPDSRPTFGLDDGETDGIVLANALDVDAFLTDEFGSGDFALIHAALDGPRIVPTPRLICDYARAGHVAVENARTLVEHIGDRRSWSHSPYVQLLLQDL